MSHRFARYFTLLLLAALAAPSAFPAPASWRGATSSEWSTSTNWSGGLIGANGATASIVTNVGGHQPVVSDASTFTVGNINFASGNSLTFDRSVATTYAYIIGNAGSVILSGSGTVTFSGANTYTGATTINAGELNLTGKLGNTAVTVGPSGTLAFGGGTVGGSITSSGLLDAGLLTATDSGSLTLQAGGTLQLALGSTSSFGRYAVAGQFTPGGTLQVQLANSFSPTLGNSFDLLDFGSLGAGTFASLSLPALDPGLGWNTSALYTTGTISVMTAVPEPTEYAMLAGAFAMGIALWRRRKRE